MWVKAETSDSLVADYRQLLADLVSNNSDTNMMDFVDMNKSTDDVICEVKTRLFRSHVPWLLVFDNLEDRNLLNKFMPHGAGARGHVLVTTRHVDVEAGHEHVGNLVLGCFSRKESLELLRRSVGPHNLKSQEDEDAARNLSDKLGNLPLALGMAAAYMRKCDVKVSEYLERYSDQSLYHGKLNDYTLSVASSLSLSLEEVEKISPDACEVLKLLAFLGPDQITKSLIRHLLRAKKVVSHEDHLRKRSKTAKCAAVLLLSVAVSTTAMSNRRSTAIFAISTLVAAIAILDVGSAKGNVQDSVSEKMASPNRMSSALFSSTEYEQSDVAWNVLKSFSLLTVKEGKGNVHRLLQHAMRACQDLDKCKHNLSVCITAMTSMWTFKTNDTDSWKESLSILEHVKSAVSHCVDCLNLDTTHTMQAAHLSRETAVLTAMSLNAFSDAKAALDLSLKLYENAKLSKPANFYIARAETLYELGRVFRYQGMYEDSKASLEEALCIYNRLNKRSYVVHNGIANTLHEVGLLELKQHNLKDAEKNLNESLELRRNSTNFSDINPQCAATLHQLAAVHVARRPPSLDTAKKLLLEALSLSSQIGQRAATLKQLARVTIRQGLLDAAENYLEQALELYAELYADNKLHMNIAAVQFQRVRICEARQLC